MFIFGFGKKDAGSSCCTDKNEAANSPNCCVDAKNAKFIVLGACCKKSQETFENTKKAVAELGLDELVVNIGDMAEIAKYGVMQTPALVISGKVVSYGKMLKVDEVKALIEKANC